MEVVDEAEWPNGYGNPGRGSEPIAIESREKLLHAAVQVAVRDGIMAMTLDAVARRRASARAVCSTTFAARTT